MDHAAYTDPAQSSFRTRQGVASLELLPYLDITKQTYDWGVD